MKLEEIVSQFESQKAFAEAVDNKLRDLMVENPSFRYKDDVKLESSCSYDGPCTYRPLDGPTKLNGPQCSGCIFGQALQSLGWTDREELGGTSTIDVIMDGLCIDYPSYWRVIQARQDEGDAWGNLLGHLS